MIKTNNLFTCFCISFIIILVLIAGCTQQEWQPTYGKEYTVSVTSIIDGDTIQIILPHGEEVILRFLGIDCPEKTPDANNPGEYHNITNQTCLAYYGNKATRFLSSLIEGETITISFDPRSGFKDIYDRWLATPSLTNGTNINILLLQKGYARTYTEGDCEQEHQYILYEQIAIQEKQGLWSCQSSSHDLIIEYVHYDASGNDNENLNDEYVIITYQSDLNSSDINISGYVLKDASQNTYMIPPGTSLSPQQSITIFSGSGKDSTIEKFWNSSQAIWGNIKDTVFLYDNNNQLVDSYQWP